MTVKIEISWRESKERGGWGLLRIKSIKRYDVENIILGFGDRAVTIVS